MAISDSSVLEGNSGSQFMVFTVTVLQPSAVPVTMNYSTSVGTATAEMLRCRSCRATTG
jgi:hypothetical protein